MPESVKDEFNTKVTDIKRNLLVKIKCLRDEITSVRKDIDEATFDQNLIEIINQHQSKLKHEIKLLKLKNIFQNTMSAISKRSLILHCSVIM